jgi:hypothetical protein
MHTMVNKMRRKDGNFSLLIRLHDSIKEVKSLMYPWFNPYQNNMLVLLFERVRLINQIMSRAFEVG